MNTSPLKLFRQKDRPQRLEFCYNELRLTHANSANNIVPLPELHKLTSTSPTSKELFEDNF
jgi:hypothetical protein